MCVDKVATLTSCSVPMIRMATSEFLTLVLRLLGMQPSGLDAIFRASHLGEPALVDLAILGLAVFLVEDAVESFHRSAAQGFAGAVDAMQAGFNIPDYVLCRIVDFLGHFSFLKDED